MLLERVDGVSRVTRAWDGQTVVCIASGPSLTREQVEMVRVAGLRAIVVNDNYLMAPWADLVYFADTKWWTWQKGKPEWAEFKGQKCTIFSHGNAVPDASIHVLKNAGGGDQHKALSTDPGSIMTGSHSGYQAINIAVLSGAKRIILIGYDCKRGVDGKRHWFGNHPDNSEPPYKAIIERFGFAMNDARKLGIEIFNCSTDTAIEAFPKRPLESLLADSTAAVV